MTYTTDVNFCTTLCDGEKFSVRAKSLAEHQEKFIVKLTYKGAFVKFGEPFVVEKDVVDLQKYNYGYFVYRSRRFYFSVDKYEALNTKKSRVYYTVDWFETYRFDMQFYNNARILRSTNSLFSLRKYDFYPFERSIPPIQIENRKIFTGFDIIVYVISTDNQKKIFVCRSTTQHNYVRDYNIGNFPKILLNMHLISGLDEIKGMFIAPSTLINVSEWGSVEGESIYTFRANFAYNPKNSFNVQISTSPGKLTLFKDFHDNIVWRAPVNDPNFADYNKNCKVDVYFDCSSSSCTFKFFVYLTDKFIEKFELFADNLEVFNNSYEQYRVRQREYDLEMRKITQEKGLLSGFTQSGNSAIAGAIAGGPYGALAGLGLGAFGNVANFFIEKHYGDKEQNATDSLYRRQLPSQVTTGSGTWYVYNAFCGFFDYKWSNSDWNHQLDNGYIIDMNISDFTNKYEILQNSSKKEFLKAEIDFTTTENCNLPREIRDGIKGRFANGMWFL